jgi:hypothetical protein
MPTTLLMVFVVFVVPIVGLFVYGYRQTAKEAERSEYIRTYTLPIGLYDKLREKHPALSLKDCQLVGRGLRKFFLTHLSSGRQYVSMPSQVVDDLWHEFILHTREYEKFCDKAFARFFHHKPAAAMNLSRQHSNEGLRRCWWHACREENINPRSPTRLPLLFALDAKLNIPNGFRYAANCSPMRDSGGTTAGTEVIYCAGDFSSNSFDGSTVGFGDGSDSGSGSDGGGCGGGGCGGGGGGD